MVKKKKECRSSEGVFILRADLERVLPQVEHNTMSTYFGRTEENQHRSCSWEFWKSKKTPYSVSSLDLAKHSNLAL
jgi:hypothetical protein